MGNINYDDIPRHEGDKGFHSVMWEPIDLPCCPHHPDERRRCEYDYKTPKLNDNIT